MSLAPGAPARADARTRLLALLGHPVAHSVSPAMHDAGLAAAGLNARYLAFDVAPADLAAAVSGLRALGCVGFNVTLPHKEAALRLVDEVSDLAAAVGAINCVTIRDGRLVGTNTDCPGLLASLRAETGFDPRGARVAILGAGGFARAAAVAAVTAGAARVTVINRTALRAERLAADVNGALAGRLTPPGLRVVSCARGTRAAEEALRAADAVWNATPVGMHPDVDETPLPQIDLLPSHCLVYDAVFNPPETALVRAARARGLSALGGLGTLVHQGALCWQEWFAQPAPVDLMRAAAARALADRAGGEATRRR